MVKRSYCIERGDPSENISVAINLPEIQREVTGWKKPATRRRLEGLSPTSCRHIKSLLLTRTKDPSNLCDFVPESATMYAHEMRASSARKSAISTKDPKAGGLAGSEVSSNPFCGFDAHMNAERLTITNQPSRSLSISCWLTIFVPSSNHCSFSAAHKK